MSLNYVCIECGLSVDNLLVEYGEKNFRLTRCSHCGQVADKYIECELLLVLLDVFLHRKPAFRHLMFNRYHPVVATRAVRWMSVVLLVISLALQLIVLRHTLYRRVNAWTLLAILLASAFELAIFASTLIVYSMYQSSFQAISTTYAGSFTRLFLCITFPEVFRVVAIILYMFDSHADLLVLISLLVLSMQLVSIHSTTNMRKELVIGGLVVASFLRLLLLRCFYDSRDIWTLGGFT